MRKTTAAKLSIAMGITVILLLAALHLLSPEFDPTWRVISEYALGQFGWVLSLMFIAGAFNAWLLAYSLRNEITTKWGKVGLGFLIASGAGSAMASVFEIPHPMHNLAGLIGVLCLPIAAMLISVHLTKIPEWVKSKTLIMWTANLTWIGLVIFVISMVILMTTYTQSGGDMNVKPDAVEKVLPKGTIAFNGITNRVLVLLTPLWTITVARQVIRLNR